MSYNVGAVGRVDRRMEGARRTRRRAARPRGPRLPHDPSDHAATASRSRHFECFIPTGRAGSPTAARAPAGPIAPETKVAAYAPYAKTRARRDHRPGLLVYGHSHVRCARADGERAEYSRNAGSWLDAPTYLRLTDEVVELRRWDGSSEGDVSQLDQSMTRGSAGRGVGKCRAHRKR